MSLRVMPEVRKRAVIGASLGATAPRLRAFLEGFFWLRPSTTNVGVDWILNFSTAPFLDDAVHQAARLTSRTPEVEEDRLAGFDHLLEIVQMLEVHRFGSFAKYHVRLNCSGDPIVP